MENDSEYAQSVANRLHAEGTEMQLNMQQSIANFKQQSDVATSANASLQIINRRAYNELGVEYGRDYVPDLDPYDRQVGWNLNTGLRDYVGKTGNHPGFGLKHDEARWVRIDAGLRYSYFRDTSAYRPLERLYWRNRGGREEIDRDMAQFRLQTLFEIMHHSVAHRRRVRIQMLAFGVMPDVPRGDEYIKRCNVTPAVVILDDGLLIEPIAVRAPSAHTLGDNWLLTPGAVTMMPSSFHVTSLENFYVIFEDGVVPGGGSGRIVKFFNAFTP